MKRFKNILVGIDLTTGDGSVSAELSPPNQEAVERSLWLAKMNAARLTFLYAVDDPSATQRITQESLESDAAVFQEAKEALNPLVARAAALSITADTEVRCGKSWLEIVRQVLRNGHDLVVAGTRRLGAIEGFLVGSTAIKLLRKCPCPVWITKPQEERHIKSILVAHCLRNVGDLAMELGCSMAQLHAGQLHVLHSLEFPEFASALPARIPAAKMAQFRLHAKRHIEAHLEKYTFAQPPQVHIVTDTPDHATLRHIDRYAIELLVMGTVARTGVTGFITGNTAERLLPQIRCSVLAVKPHDFMCPITGE